MIARTLPLLALSILAACSVEATRTEADLGTTSEAIVVTPPPGGVVAPPGGPITQTISVSNISVSPTDTALLVDFALQGVASVNVVLTGSDGSSRSIAGTSVVFFQGLAPCTSYTYAFMIGASALPGGGQVNTRLSGNTVCPSSEITASTVYKFHGVNHQQGGTLCGAGTFSEYPLGTGWVYQEGAGTNANVGAYFFDDPGTQPAPCWELLTDVSRARFDFTLSPMQLRRLKDASFEANYGNEYGTTACASFNEQMNVMLTTVPTATYSETSANGNTWMSALGAPLTNKFLEQPGGAIPQQVVSSSNGLMTIDFGQWTQPTLQVGLKVNQDGFDLVNNKFSPQGPASCTASLTNAGLVLAYNDLPPETPTSCSVAYNCTTSVITCNNSPDSFTLYRASPTTLGVTVPVTTVSGSAGGGSITLTDTAANGWGYEVCAKTNANDSASVCTNVGTVTSNVACPPSSGSSSGSGSSGGGAVGGSGYLPPPPTTPVKHTQT